MHIETDVGEYMAFGLSKDDTKTKMVGSDAVVTWIDHQGRGHAVDYYLGSKEQVRVYCST